MTLTQGYAYLIGVVLSATGGEDFWTTPNQCAAWSVYQSARLCSREISVDDVDRELPADGRYKSAASISSALAKFGISSYLWRFPGKRIDGSTFPVIVPLRPHAKYETVHFVTVAGVVGEQALLVDGPRPPRYLSLQDLTAQWEGDGVGIVVGEAHPSLHMLWKVPTFRRSIWLVAALAAAVVVVWRHMKFRRQRGASQTLTTALVAAGLFTGCQVQEPEGRIMITAINGGEATFLDEDLSKMRNKAVVNARAAYEIINLTAKRVAILGHRSDCNCAEFQGLPETLEPKEAKRFTVNLPGRPSGALTNSFQILLSDQEQPVLEGRVWRRSLVEPPYLVSDAKLNVGEFYVGEPIALTFSIRAFEKADSPWIGDAYTQDASGKIEIARRERAVGKSGFGEYEYAISFRPKLTGIGEQSAIVFLKDKEGKTIEVIDARYKVKPEVQVYPPRVVVNLNATSKSERIIRKLVLHYRRPPLQVDLLANLELLPSWLVARRLLDAPETVERAFQIEIDPRALPVGLSKATLQFRNHEDSTIKVPVEVEVSPSR